MTLAEGSMAAQVAVKRAQVIGLGIIPEAQWERASLKERMALVDEVLAWMYDATASGSKARCAELPG